MLGTVHDRIQQHRSPAQLHARPGLHAGTGGGQHRRAEELLDILVEEGVSCFRLIGCLTYTRMETTLGGTTTVDAVTNAHPAPMTTTCGAWRISTSARPSMTKRPTSVCPDGSKYYSSDRQSVEEYDADISRRPCAWVIALGQATSINGDSMSKHFGTTTSCAGCGAPSLHPAETTDAPPSLQSMLGTSSVRRFGRSSGTR